MGCDTGKFLLGFGIGAVMGFLAHKYSKTPHARKIRMDLHRSWRDIETATNNVLNDAVHKSKHTGAKVAGMVADKANEVQEYLTEPEK